MYLMLYFIYPGSYDFDYDSNLQIIQNSEVLEDIINGLSDTKQDIQGNKNKLHGIVYRFFIILFKESCFIRM